MLKGLLLGLGRFAACCVVAMFSMAALGQALPKVVYVGSTWYGHAPVWVGIEKGLFKNEGFDVEFLHGDNDWPSVMKALDEIGYNGWGIAEQGGGDSPEGLRKLSSAMDQIFAS